MKFRRTLSNPARRRLITGGAGLAALMLLGRPGDSLAQPDGPGARHMRSISADLLKAARSGDYNDFLRAVRRYADIGEIADYSLGQYRDRLKPAHSSRYQRGVMGFMARFFALESRKYNVVGGEVTGETPRENGEILVHSQIRLASGTTYSVNWLLKPRGRRFKVRDVQVLGFWLTWFQRRMFVNFIQKHGGDLRALLSALRV